MSGILDNPATKWDRAGTQKRPSFSRPHASVPLRTAALSCARSQGRPPVLVPHREVGPRGDQGGNHGRGGGGPGRPMQGRQAELVPRREVGPRGDQGGQHGRGFGGPGRPMQGRQAILVPRLKVGARGQTRPHPHGRRRLEELARVPPPALRRVGRAAPGRPQGEDQYGGEKPQPRHIPSSHNC